MSSAIEKEGREKEQKGRERDSERESQEQPERRCEFKIFRNILSIKGKI
jgi:hypothetical protein